MEMGKRNFLAQTNEIRYDVKLYELNEECIAMNDRYGLQASDLRKTFTYNLVSTLGRLYREKRKREIGLPEISREK